MTYANMPLIIPILATGYLLAIYLLLMLARRFGIWQRPERSRANRSSNP